MKKYETKPADEDGYDLKIPPAPSDKKAGEKIVAALRKWTARHVAEPE